MKKTYTVNYSNLESGNSKTIQVEAENLKEAKSLAQKHKNFPNAKKYITSVSLKKD